VPTLRIASHHQIFLRPSNKSDFSNLVCKIEPKLTRHPTQLGSRAIDEYSGTSYEHRRAWVEDKVLWLSLVFAIGICAYAVLSNHVHLVLCVDKDKAMSCIQKRTEAIQQNKRQPHKLLPFVGNPRQDMPQGNAFSLQDYCELVDTTARVLLLPLPQLRILMKMITHSPAVSG